MSDDKMRERWQDWINNLRKIDDITETEKEILDAISKHEPLEEEFFINPNYISFVEDVVRENGLEHNQEYIEMVALAMTTVEEIKGRKMPELLWQYITIILWNWFAQVPPSKRMSQMQVAFILGMSFERSVDWEVD